MVGSVKGPTRRSCREREARKEMKARTGPGAIQLGGRGSLMHAHVAALLSGDEDYSTKLQKHEKLK